MLLVIELQLVVWSGWYADRSGGNAAAELEVSLSVLCIV